VSVAAFDHPWISGLLGDKEAASRLGAEAELAAMLAFEAALAESEAEHGVIPPRAAAAIVAALQAFRPDVPSLHRAVARDGVVVPDLVRQIRAAVGEHGPSVHFGATSQDVIDTALVLRVRTILDLLEARIEGMIGALDALAARSGARPLMGRTRMQAAIPITAADRIAAWREPLRRARSRLPVLRAEVLVLQFGGAAGTLAALGDKADAVRDGLASLLGLASVPQWQSQRDRIMLLGGWLAEVSGSLGKLGQDIALLAQAGEEIVLAGGGGSSAMPHKQNPVAAEALVTLARFNAAQLGGLHQSMVHEQERSGSAWTLEWLLLPPMLMATASSLRLAAGLLAAVGVLGDVSADALGASCAPRL
jgi:3-carboxy-cis,cis-muconate cycloisomerase